jgi:diacylglycerol kinase family enzyme
MKHIFLINPAAGKGKSSTEILPEIIKTVKRRDIDYEIHRTVNVGDATRYVRLRCEEAAGAPIRFYAVGGDGTMNEALNGLYGYEGAQLAVMPAGTGNDFVRSFGTKRRFLDVDRQLDGSPKRVDAMRYELLGPEGHPLTNAEERASGEGVRYGVGAHSGRTIPVSGYALNMFNMGFDAEVAAKVENVKSMPFIGGAAYIGGALATLIGKHPLPLAVEVDGAQVAEGDFLFAGAANGRFSGGGFEGMPEAVVDDGRLNILLIRVLTRRLMLSMFGKYREGVYMDDPRVTGKFEHHLAREAVFRPKERMVMAIDGEPVEVGAIRFTVQPAAVDLSLPA